MKGARVGSGVVLGDEEREDSCGHGLGWTLLLGLGGGRRKILEQRPGALLERLSGCRLLDLGQYRSLELERRQLGRLLGLRLRLDLRDFGRRATALGWLGLDRRWGRLRLDRPASALLGGGLVRALSLLAFPAHAHRRHLVVLQRREVTAHEDVHLLENAQELFRCDAELRRQIVYSRLDHSILHQERTGAGDTDAVGQCAVPYPNRHYGWLSQLRADRGGARSWYDRDALPRSQSDHLFRCAWTGIGRHDHAPALSALQLSSHRLHSDDDASRHGSRDR